MNAGGILPSPDLDDDEMIMMSPQLVAAAAMTRLRKMEEQK
jgi:hypothetical protein